MRTVTLIFKADTVNEYRAVYSIPVGDGCALALIDEADTYYIVDPDRGIPSNEAWDNDAVVYIIPYN